MACGCGKKKAAARRAAQEIAQTAAASTQTSAPATWSGKTDAK